jgi:hypothetical protein
LRSEISSKEPDARSASPVLREGWLGNQPSLLDFVVRWALASDCR